MKNRPSWTLLAVVSALSLAIGLTIGQLSVPEPEDSLDTNQADSALPKRTKSTDASREWNIKFENPGPRLSKLPENHSKLSGDVLEELRVVLQTEIAEKRIRTMSGKELMQWLNESLMIDPEGTFQLIARGNSRVAGGLYLFWLDQDKESAEKWLRGLAGNPAHAPMFREILQSSVWKAPELSLQLANGLESEEDRFAVWRDSVYNWSRMDETEIADLLDEAGLSADRRAEIEEERDSITYAANQSKNRRNAQNLASVASSAQAAGLQFDHTSLAAMVRHVVAGGEVTSGAFEGTYFAVPNMSAEEQADAMRHLSLQNGVLRYHEEPVGRSD